MGLAREAVVVAFGSPFIMNDLPGAPALCAFSANAAAQRAAAGALFGGVRVMGRMPMSLIP